MQVGNFFSYGDFEKSETATRLGIVNIINTQEIRDNIKSLVISVLDPLRVGIGKPIKINSGYRCQELNARVGGVSTSQHTKGEASDIVVVGMSPYELAKRVVELQLPYDQLILYPTFVHVSHSRIHNRGQVLYNKSYRGQRL